MQTENIFKDISFQLIEPTCLSHNPSLIHPLIYSANRDKHLKHKSNTQPGNGTKHCHYFPLHYTMWNYISTKSRSIMFHKCHDVCVCVRTGSLLPCLNSFNWPSDWVSNLPWFIRIDLAVSLSLKVYFSLFPFLLLDSRSKFWLVRSCWLTFCDRSYESFG